MTARECRNDAHAPDARCDGPFFPNGRPSHVDGLDALPEFVNPQEAMRDE